MTTQKPQKDLSIPKYHRRVMVFDTETSGLMPKHKFGTPFPPIEEYPHIMQFSWIVYNVATNTIEETVDEYVQIPDDAPISPESTKVNGITREMTKEKGKPIAPLLVKFFASYMRCDCIVAHNLRFDGEMVRKEMWRNRKELEKHVTKERVNVMCGVFTVKYNAACHIDTFCTMMNTIQFCGIDWVPKIKDSAAIELKDIVIELNESESDPSNLPKSPATNQRKKFPRLDELYGKLFDTPLPKDMHNSIVDVLVCLRCFLKIRGAKELSEDTFLELVNIHTTEK